ncbi:MAG: ComF family protein [Bacteroidales bacterium]|jgi:ComF family protein|nr:ComF family protein [Bacteroidales bacterium]
MRKYFKELSRILFPAVCPGCERPIYTHNKILCSLCERDLPFTYYQDMKDNTVEQAFWGRVNIECATALLFYEKHDIVQRLLHSIKYHTNKDLAIRLGELLGSQIKEAYRFRGIDAIIPVPLHKKKLLKRGFNQSYLISKGINISTGIPVETNLLLRVKNTESQTKKSRTERCDNVKKAFAVNNNNRWENKHFIIIDDVITTGATLESCITELLSIKGAKVSVASIATVL